MCVAAIELAFDVLLDFIPACSNVAAGFVIQRFGAAATNQRSLPDLDSRLDFGPHGFARRTTGLP